MKKNATIVVLGIVAGIGLYSSIFANYDPYGSYPQHGYNSSFYNTPYENGEETYINGYGNRNNRINEAHRTRLYGKLQIPGPGEDSVQTFYQPDMSGDYPINAYNQSLHPYEQQQEAHYQQWRPSLDARFEGNSLNHTYDRGHLRP